MVTRQERFAANEIVRNLVRFGAKELALAATSAVIEDILTFHNSPLAGKRGFHATLRNFAIRHGQTFFVDTFPPFGTPQETLNFVSQHAPNFKVAGLVRRPVSFFT